MAATVAVFLALFALVATGAPAHATYPGATNGRLAVGMVVDDNADIYGSCQHTVTAGPNDYRRGRLTARSWPCSTSQPATSR